MKGEMAITSTKKERIVITFEDIVELFRTKGFDISAHKNIALCTAGIMHKQLHADEWVAFEVCTYTPGESRNG